jgi:hypothetical protein
MARRLVSHGHLNRVFLLIWRARKPDAAAPGSGTCTSVASDESKEEPMRFSLPNLGDSILDATLLLTLCHAQPCFAL